MNRSDYEKYLKTLTKEQLLDIRDLAEIEYLKRVIWEEASKFLKDNFEDKEFIEFQGRNLKPNIIAKHFYEELNNEFIENKYYFLKKPKSGEECTMSKINKLS